MFVNFRGGEVRICHRGCVITGDCPKEERPVLGVRPGRRTLALVDNPQAGMRWTGLDVARQKIRDAAWLAPGPRRPSGQAAELTGPSRRRVPDRRLEPVPGRAAAGRRRKERAKRAGGPDDVRAT